MFFPRSVDLVSDGLKAEVHHGLLNLNTAVWIEMRNSDIQIDPNETHTVSPYIAELTEGFVYPSSEVVVLSPERTFWEKATLIHVECNRGELRASADALSGHWYDLVMLVKHPAGRSAIENRQIFRIILIYYKKVIA
jgi:hypothetical protein